MGYRRLFIMRKDLHLSHGKLDAQLMHCAEAYWTNMIKKEGHITEGTVVFYEDMYEVYDIADYVPNDNFTYKVPVYVVKDMVINKQLYDEYVNGTFTKTVCEARNKNHLLKAKTMAEEIGLVEGLGYGLIYDKCLTELTPEEEDGTTLTGIWFAPLPDETAHKISKKYQLYK